MMNRFIPVYTGNTLCHYITSSYFSGLSLCIQGTLNFFCFSTPFSRFIPVHTGNTGVIRRRRRRYSVYPCAYREHAFPNFFYYFFGGLSLCIQGTRNYANFINCLMRFIPVHTGNTSASCMSKSMTSVYPCAYREH